MLCSLMLLQSDSFLTRVLFGCLVVLFYFTLSLKIVVQQLFISGLSNNQHLGCSQMDLDRLPRLLISFESLYAFH